VGALVIESEHPKDQRHVSSESWRSILPTVALVARAVGLAVEAEHARRDVARERDAERRRSSETSMTGSGRSLRA
jgi:hypothetical protein